MSLWGDELIGEVRHRSRWADRDHGPDVRPLPPPPPTPRVSRDVLRAAIYGERRRGARWTSF